MALTAGSPQLVLLMLQAAIFDMDGLLMDTEPLWVGAMRNVFHRLGVPMTPEEAVMTTGLRAVEVMDYWYERYPWSGPSREEVIAEIVGTVCGQVQAEGKLMEGVHGAIGFFRNRGMRVGLASSSHLHFIETALAHFGLRPLFDAVHSAEGERYGKPHPDVYIHCAQKLGVRPVDCIAFEDSINGMVAARAARMKVVAVPEPHNWEDPRYALADAKIPSLVHFNEGLFRELSTGLQNQVAGGQ